MMIVVPHVINGGGAGPVEAVWLLPLEHGAAATPVDPYPPALEDKFGSNPLPTPLF